MDFQDLQPKIKLDRPTQQTLREERRGYDYSLSNNT
jgi:hypothetical protein